ncbi:MAG TPA: hypothetical protein VF177_00915 [Anaerolineae bacterium]
MDKTPILEGQQVLLRPLSEEDIPLLARWLFDPEVLHWLQLSEDPPELRTIEAVRERYGEPMDMVLLGILRDEFL